MTAMTLACLPLIVLAAGLLMLTVDTLPPAPNNPRFPGADPHALLLGDTVWVYPTWSKPGERAFYAFSSRDLVHWQRHGPVLKLDDVAWIDDDGAPRHHAWAPALLEKDGRYYFYFSVGPQKPTPSRIGVAVGDSPAGPFADSGRPLLTGENDVFEAIDPMAFTDPAPGPRNGKTYLYSGGSNGSRLRIHELADDLVSLAREIPVDNPPHFTEGAFMHERRGIYYLSYSHGWWRGDSYSVHYATAPSPTGPFTHRGPILQSDTRHKGPGHHSILHDPARDTWHIVYHRWNHPEGDPPYRGHRSVAIETFTYDDEGLIRPITMTD